MRMCYVNLSLKMFYPAVRTEGNDTRGDEKEPEKSSRSQRERRQRPPPPHLIYKKWQVGNIAGSAVEDGVINKGSSVLVKRRGRIIHEGTLKTLKNVKADVQQMVTGTECGIQVLFVCVCVARASFFEVFMC